MAKTNAKQGTTDKWEDSLGQEFRPGDLISVAVINGRSPQMVVAKVERINTTNPKGEPHTKTKATGRRVPQEYPRREYVGPELEDVYASGGVRRPDRAAMQRNWDKQNDPANWKTWTETRMVPEYHEAPSVTITATPILDGRGFYRSNGQQTWVWDEKAQDGHYETDLTKPKTRPVTYTLIGNIIKLPGHVTEDFIAGLAESRQVEW